MCRCEKSKGASRELSRSDVPWEVCHGAAEWRGSCWARGVAALYVNANAPKKPKAALVVTRGATWKLTVNNSRHSISQMLRQGLTKPLRTWLWHFQLIRILSDVALGDGATGNRSCVCLIGHVCVREWIHLVWSTGLQKNSNTGGFNCKMSNAVRIKNGVGRTGSDLSHPIWVFVRRDFQYEKANSCCD